MALVLLIRHGHTDTADRRLTGRLPGVHLSERGRRQAEALPDRLAGLPIHAIYTSPLERCRETAAPLAEARGIPAVVTDDVVESGMGEWEGRPLGQLARTKLWRLVQVAPSAFRFPGGESLREVQDRAVADLMRIAAAHPRHVVAVFSHGDPIRLSLAFFLGLHMDLFQRLVVTPASVSAVWVGDGPPRVLKLNDTGDLADLAPPRRSSARKLRR